MCAPFGGDHKCQCKPGYSGSGLNGTSCRPVCSGQVGMEACGGPNQGLCSGPNHCTCKPSWGGAKCDKRTAPATCKEAQKTSGMAKLYVGNEKAQPYRAQC